MRYDKWKWGVEPFYPNHMLYQGIIVSLVLLVLFVFVFFAPGVFMAPEIPADPAASPDHVKPEWYFLPTYQWLKYFPSEIFGSLGTLVGIMTQMPIMFVLVLLPFLDRSKERDTRRRPIFLATALVILLFVLAVGICGADPVGATEIGRPNAQHLPAYTAVRLLYDNGTPVEDPKFLGVRYVILVGVFLEVLLAAGVLVPPALYWLRRRDAPQRRWLLALSGACAVVLLLLGICGHFLG